MLTGSGVTLAPRLIDYLIAWKKERREQKSSKTADEKDRPRFSIDIAKGKTDHPHVPAAVVKILSLGSLPLTINDGEVFITSKHYPEYVKPHKLDRREISPVHPIEVSFPLPGKLTHPIGVGEPEVKMVCKFSYGEDNERYEEERKYNPRTGWFD